MALFWLEFGPVGPIDCGVVTFGRAVNPQHGAAPLQPAHVSGCDRMEKLFLDGVPTPRNPVPLICGGVFSACLGVFVNFCAAIPNDGDVIDDSLSAESICRAGKVFGRAAEVFCSPAENPEIKNVARGLMVVEEVAGLRRFSLCSRMNCPIRATKGDSP